MLIYVLPLEIKNTVNKQTGELTNVQLLLKELSPINAPVKLFGQPASILNELQGYINEKQPIALPVRTGTLDNGNVWRSLDEADILPVSRDFVRKKQLEEFERLKAILYPDESTLQAQLISDQAHKQPEPVEESKPVEQSKPVLNMGIMAGKK